MKKRLLSLVMSLALIFGSAITSNAASINESENATVTDAAAESEEESEACEVTFDETNEVEEADSATSWRTIYANYIINNKAEFSLDSTYSLQEKSIWFKFYDMNRDGTPEMFFYHPACWFDVYTISNGNVISEVYQMGQEYITADGHLISIMTIAGMATYDTYINNGNFVSDSAFASWELDTFQVSLKGSTKANWQKWLQNHTSYYYDANVNNLKYSHKIGNVRLDDLKDYVPSSITNTGIKNFLNSVNYADNVSHIAGHAYITGTCMMVDPYTGDYLIGITTNPELKASSIELLVLDCTRYSQGLDAWVFSTGKCGLTNSSVWARWHPQYGYYWTLFRAYDENGEIIDEICYGFANVF